MSSITHNNDENNDKIIISSFIPSLKVFGLLVGVAMKLP